MVNNAALPVVNLGAENPANPAEFDRKSLTYNGKYRERQNVPVRHKLPHCDSPWINDGQAVLSASRYSDSGGTQPVPVRANSSCAVVGRGDRAPEITART